MRWLVIVAGVTWLSGCVESNAVVCANGAVCPEDTTCNVQLGLCVTEQQSAACMGKADGEACDVTAADEVCFQGACLPSLCGDGITGPGEVCDDGNAVGGDGCSARCDSKESCGNAVTDLERGEDCDDGNLLDHDGCSSACVLEQPRWSHRPTAPSARMAPTIAYDSDRDRIVLVGGLGNRLVSSGVYSLSLDDWWEWDGRWRETRTAAPTPKNFAVMAYDEARKRTVFFGGGVGGQIPETWEYDGKTWTLVGLGGPARMDAAVAYDAVRKRVVIHGGRDPNNASGVPESDQWAWDGTSWQQLPLSNQSTLPNPRTGASMAFDYKRGTLLLFGGSTTSGTRMNDLWEYNGTTWTNRTANGASGTNIPTPREDAMMAWNGTCECVVLFGGSTGVSIVNNDTFTWNGTAWTKITATAGTPTARSFAGITHDGHGRTLMVGGSKYVGTNSADETAYLEETWLFDGTKWQLDIARYYSALALDTDRHRVVMYGGGIVGGSEGSPDTYELSELGWKLKSQAPGPNPRGSAMAYDEARHEMILLGPDAPATWAWNGTSWSSKSLVTEPVRANSALVYDRAHQEIVAFGGSAGSVDSNETWTWNGTAWTNKQPATAPSARAQAVIGFDRVRNEVILFGGFVSSGTGWVTDTWRWDGTTWTQVTGGTQPTPTGTRPMMAWDPARRRLVLLTGDYLDAWEWDGTWWKWLGNLGARENPSGGMAYSGFDGAGVSVMGGYYFQTFESSDTWELRWDSAHPSDVCRIGEEADGDMLAACADTDCWAVCTPTCMPGDTCSQADPHCGNGTCDAAESCRSCPADCTTCGSTCGDGVCDTGEACPGDCS